MDNQRYIKNVGSLLLDSEKCNACGMCIDVCPHNVFIIKDKKAYLRYKDKCMECGACELNCKESAISVKRGVGCAAAVINSYLNKTEAACCCGPDGTCC